jgi:hypothetical protein
VVQTVSLNVPPLQLWDADPSVLQHMVDAFHSRRDLVVGLLKDSRNKINVPEGAFMYSQTYLRSSEKH